MLAAELLWPPARPGADSASSRVVPRRCDRQGKTQNPIKAAGLCRPQLLAACCSHPRFTLAWPCPSIAAGDSTLECRMGGGQGLCSWEVAVAGQVLTCPSVISCPPLAGRGLLWVGAALAEGPWE